MQIVFTGVCIFVCVAHAGDGDTIAIACVPLWSWALFGACIVPILTFTYWAMRVIQSLLEVWFSGVKHSTYVVIAVSKPFRCADRPTQWPSCSCVRHAMYELHDASLCMHPQSAYPTEGCASMRPLSSRCVLLGDIIAVTVK